jgi:hypothetical protein
MSIFTTEEWEQKWKPIYGLIEFLEANEVVVEYQAERLWIQGNQKVINQCQIEIQAHSEEIIQVLKWRPFGPPLVQDPAIYKVPVYTDEEKREMTRHYLKSLETPRDDAPLVIEEGDIVHDFDEHDERASKSTRTKTGFFVTGRCFYCFQPIGADQPGGLNPRHVSDNVPYGECEPARKEKERESNV